TPADLNLWVDRAQQDALVVRVVETGGFRNQEFRFRTKEGEIRTALGSAALVEIDGEPCVLTIAADVTRERRIQEELVDVSARLVNTQEEERSRFARELHDVLGQKLALLALELQQLEENMPRSRSRISSSLHRMWTQVVEINKESHRVSRRLHPT